MCCVCVHVWVCLNGIWFLLISSTGICCPVAASLLLVNLNRVTLLHFQWSRCIVLIDRLSIESKSHDLHGKSLQKGLKMIYILFIWRVGKLLAIVNATYRSVTIGIHQFAQRRVFFYFELDDSIILTQDLQVNMLGFSLKRKKQICCYTYVHM